MSVRLASLRVIRPAPRVTRRDIVDAARLTVSELEGRCRLTRTEIARLVGAGRTGLRGLMSAERKLPDAAVLASLSTLGAAYGITRLSHYYAPDEGALVEAARALVGPALALAALVSPSSLAS